jgi:hypothetical protein
VATSASLDENIGHVLGTKCECAFGGSHVSPSGEGFLAGGPNWDLPDGVAVLLDELAEQLGSGQFYSRDVHTIAEPLSRVAAHYGRRCRECCRMSRCGTADLGVPRDLRSSTMILTSGSVAGAQNRDAVDGDGNPLSASDSSPSAR